MRRHISSFIILSFARMRSRRVILLIWNLPVCVLPQMKVKPRKLKVSGLPSPYRLRRSAAKRPNSISRVFSGWSVIQEATGVALVLKADDEVVGVPHDDYVARGFAPSPALGPKVERVVRVDIGKQR